MEGATVLDWKRVGESWFGNGFRVRQVAPTRWSLEHARAAESIDVVDPIAELGTLQACKHKAESLHEIERVRDLRRRLLAVGVGSWSLALIIGNPVGFLVLGVIGSAALLELAASWTDGKVGGFRSYSQ